MSGTMIYGLPNDTVAQLTETTFTDYGDMPAAALGIFLDDDYATYNNHVDVIENLRFCHNKLLEAGLPAPVVAVNYIASQIRSTDTGRPLHGFGQVDPAIAVVGLSMGVVYGFDFLGIPGRTAILTLTFENLLKRTIEFIKKV